MCTPRLEDFEPKYILKLALLSYLATHNRHGIYINASRRVQSTAINWTPPSSRPRLNFLGPRLYPVYYPPSMYALVGIIRLYGVTVDQFPYLPSTLCVYRRTISTLKLTKRDKRTGESRRKLHLANHFASKEQKEERGEKVIRRTFSFFPGSKWIRANPIPRLRELLTINYYRNSLHKIYILYRINHSIFGLLLLPRYNRYRNFHRKCTNTSFWLSCFS